MDASMDAWGQWIAALGSMALLAYLAPAALRLPPPWVRRMEVLTFTLFGAAMIAALAMAAVWFLRG